jgi:endoglucanase
MPVRLVRGVNLTNWFRFPPSRDPAALAAYLSDVALADLRGAGFDFVRLAVDPAIVADASGRAVLLAAIRRIQRQGLTVVVSPHPQGWHLEANPALILAFWQALVPALRPLDPARTVPEVLNEPVFPGDPAAWAALQHRVLLAIRQALPDSTVMLTGADWGSIGGLLALAPEADGNVLYSFHLYDPPELTSLAAWRPGLDRAALARLPFPVSDAEACAVTAAGAADIATRDVMRYYCAYGWDAARLGARIGQAASWARRHGVRLLAGEFGASAALNAPARLAWLKTVRDALETSGIGWALWGYDDSMGFAITPPPRLRPGLDRSVLAALGLSARM